MAGPADAGPRHVAYLTRTQIVLAAFLGLFLAVVVVRLLPSGPIDPVAASPLTGAAMVGGAIGVAVALLIAAAVRRELTACPPSDRERRRQRQTLLLTVAVVGFLAVVTVAPDLVGLDRPRGDVDLWGVPPSAAAGLVAAGTALVVLWAARTRPPAPE